MTYGASASAVEVVEACASVDPEVMFPDDEHGETPEALDLIADAKRVCRSCDIREACLERAIKDRHPAGVWGGLTTPEREALRRRQYRRGPKPRPVATEPSTAPAHAPAARWEDATLPFAV